MPSKPPTDNSFRKGKRPDSTARGYDHKWERIKNIYLQSYPCCEDCDLEGKHTPAALVHHIKELCHGGTHAYDNLMSLCRKHHAIRHKR